MRMVNALHLKGRVRLVSEFDPWQWNNLEPNLTYLLFELQISQAAFSLDTRVGSKTYRPKKNIFFYCMGSDLRKSTVKMLFALLFSNYFLFTERNSSQPLNMQTIDKNVIQLKHKKMFIWCCECSIYLHCLRQHKICISLSL